VRDLEVHGNDLVIATHGRGFWVIDDVTPLRQLDDVTAGTGSWLFRPATAVRLRSAGFSGTPFPKDEPRAANPPTGAVIDYLLRTAPASPITLEIYDNQGDLVRRYSSADAVPAADPAKDRVAPQWFEPPVALSAAAGMHRFVWPLHYAARPELARKDDGTLDPWADGPWVPPGAYRLVLTVDGKRLEQPLEVQPDPRVDLPASAYAEQLALARQVDALRAVLVPLAAESQAILGQLGERIPKTPSDLQPALETLRDQVTEAAGVTLTANPANAGSFPPRQLDSLRFVSDALDALYNSVEGADASPSPDARASFDRLDPMAQAAVKAWEALKSGEIAETNRRLRSANLPVIELAKENQ
jgi:hypothetical protein